VDGQCQGKFLAEDYDCWGGHGDVENDGMGFGRGVQLLLEYLAGGQFAERDAIVCNAKAVAYGFGDGLGEWIWLNF
jgi:hypothetical protein